MKIEKKIDKINFFNMMKIRLFKKNGSLFISPEDYILYFFFTKRFWSVLEISKNLVLFLRTSSEYLIRNGHGSVFKIHFQGSVEITDPCLYFLQRYG